MFMKIIILVRMVVIFINLSNFTKAHVLTIEEEIRAKEKDIPVPNPDVVLKIRMFRMKSRKQVEHENMLEKLLKL